MAAAGVDITDNAAVKTHCTPLLAGYGFDPALDFACEINEAERVAVCTQVDAADAAPPAPVPPLDVAPETAAAVRAAAPRPPIDVTDERLREPLPPGGSSPPRFSIDGAEPAQEEPVRVVTADGVKTLLSTLVTFAGGAAFRFTKSRVMPSPPMLGMRVFELDGRPSVTEICLVGDVYEVTLQPIKAEVTPEVGLSALAADGWVAE